MVINYKNKLTTHQYCCVDCFDDSYLIDYIKNRKLKGKCDFCGLKNKNVIEVESISKIILDGFFRKYEDAANSVPYESREGGYLMPTHMIDDILLDRYQILNNDKESYNELFNELVDNDGTGYVRKNVFGPPKGSLEEIQAWEYFVLKIRTEFRYTAFYQGNYIKDNKLKYFFETVLKIFDSNKLLKIIAKKESIFRARIRSENFLICNKELTSPPLSTAKTNRMSPEGISYFYGSMEKETCLYEVRPVLFNEVVVAEFRTIKEMKLLDLTNLSHPVSLFDPAYDFYFEEFVRDFLIKFTDDVSKPITSENLGTEYIPTQAFTEFIRTSSKMKYDGILFGSSIYKNGTNIVLFSGDKISDNKSKEAWLKFIKAEIFVVQNIDYKFNKINKN